MEDVMKKLVTGIIIGLALAACGGGSSGGQGSITFGPATESCSNPAALTETIQLPSSVKATDMITLKANGTTVVSEAASGSGLVPKPDGTWQEITQTTVADLQSLCAAGNASWTPGTHTLQILDSSLKVLAQGSYTVVQ
jgi:hypothetical protein